MKEFEFNITVIVASRNIKSATNKVQNYAKDAKDIKVVEIYGQKAQKRKASKGLQSSK